ncbi:MAG: DUF4301 family protein [Deltaproteobacteria bacterium]|nr:DUF4301 family protein [Deltaproteobacteria bacterium]
MAQVDLDDNDRRELERRGISEEEVRRQAALLANPPPRLRLLRPCTIGDGIRRLSDDEIDSCKTAFGAARRQQQLLKFTPASGAASRMFKALVSFRNRVGSGDRLPDTIDDREVETFIDGLPQFAFYEDLLAASGLKDGTERSSVLALIDALLSPAGLNYPALPKGLLKFHHYGSAARTPFEEHLVEAAAYACAEHAEARLHFTVSPNHRQRFEALLAAVRSTYETTLSVSFEVAFSVQPEATDTVAVDLENRLVRTRQGEIVLRPGGHGALIGNLNDLDADIVFIKNIDNVVPDHLKGPTIQWKMVLGGLLARLQTRCFELLARLARTSVEVAAIEAAVRFAQDELGITLPAELKTAGGEARRDFLVAKLNRPLRVCGMVRNQGEPGGGPFWVSNNDGTASCQIVESAEVDVGVAEQRAVLAASTHFNPVDLVCGLRNWRDERFDLRDYVNREAVFVTEKSVDGEVVKALEHPGLWNGAMAYWSSVFVEVPSATFNPVKTVNDLLRPEHQPPSRHVTI